MRKVCKRLHIRQTDIFIASIFLIVMFFACSPLMTGYCINGHDIDYHLLRIESLKTGILMGKPFLKVNVLFLGGMGYASSMFYPDFLLYIPAVLRALGVGINQSYHLFVFCCIALTWVTYYYCTKKITGARYAALLAAAAAVLGQYILNDIYVRSAMGEFTAFIFLPFVLYGIYDLLYEDFRRPFMTLIGFAGVTLCHTLSLFLCVLLYAGICICNFRKFLKKPALAGRLALTAAAVLGITCSYWLPMLEQLLSAEFYVSDAWITLEQSMCEVKSVFYNQLPAIGILLPLICLVRLGLNKRAGECRQIGFGDWLLFAGIVVTLWSTRLFPWARANAYLGFIQFPWRVFLLSSACFAMAAAIFWNSYFKRRRAREYALFLFLGLFIAGSINVLQHEEQGYYSYSNDYFDHTPFTANIIAGEWLPKTVTDKESLVEQAAVMKNDRGGQQAFSRVKNTIVFRQEGDGAAWVDVPFLYYKGYQAVMESETGRQVLTVTAEGENGKCRVYLPDTAGEVTVSYGGTLLQKVSGAISVITALVLAVYVFCQYKRRKSVV